MKKILLLLICPFLIFSQQTTLIGDVDCNGEINSEDASLILQYVTSVIDSLPCSDNMSGLTPDQLQEMINMINDSDITSNDAITMIGPMYIFNECGLDCVQVDYITGAELSNELHYFEAVLFCAQLEYDGYNDWRLPSLNGLYDWVFENNQNILPIPNFPSNGGYGDYFLAIVQGNNSIDMRQVVVGNNGNMLGTDASSWNGKCFCVR